MRILTWLLNEPFPIRRLLKVAIQRFEVGSYSFRYSINALWRSNYAYLVYEAAQMATRLGEPAVSILEFGVAGGGGLVALEYHAEEIEKIFPVKIEIYGFDTGEGLPGPVDYRDLPYHWKPGFFKMDEVTLRARLKRAKLVLGNVSETLPAFFNNYRPAPIGAVSQDLDFYSSTVTALHLFEDDTTHFLPRVFCYFDDVVGNETELYNDFTGERLAIHEFNAKHERMKLSPIYYLWYKSMMPVWRHQMWSLHFFDHNKYGTFISQENQQLTVDSYGRPSLLARGPRSHRR
jgi:hypothetical protein